MLKLMASVLVAGAWIGVVVPAAPAAPASPPALEPAPEAKINTDEGWRYYQRYCQNCHGEKGNGDGRIAGMLKQTPSNLTLLSEGNGGEFPTEMVARTIDGREDGNIHGRREMPIWGNVFRESDEIGDDEDAVHQKILELTEVLKSLDRSVQEPASQ